MIAPLMETKGFDGLPLITGKAKQPEVF